jgi:hypothetical protein
MNYRRDRVQHDHGGFGYVTDRRHDHRGEVLCVHMDGTDDTESYDTTQHVGRFTPSSASLPTLYLNDRVIYIPNAPGVLLNPMRVTGGRSGTVDKHGISVPMIEVEGANGNSSYVPRHHLQLHGRAKLYAQLPVTPTTPEITVGSVVVSLQPRTLGTVGRVAELVDGGAAVGVKWRTGSMCEDTLPKGDVVLLSHARPIAFMVGDRIRRIVDAKEGTIVRVERYEYTAEVNGTISVLEASRFTVISLIDTNLKRETAPSEATGPKMTWTPKIGERVVWTGINPGTVGVITDRNYTDDAFPGEDAAYVSVTWYDGSKADWLAVSQFRPMKGYKLRVGDYVKASGYRGTGQVIEIVDANTINVDPLGHMAIRDTEVLFVADTKTVVMPWAPDVGEAVLVSLPGYETPWDVCDVMDHDGALASVKSRRDGSVANVAISSLEPIGKYAPQIGDVIRNGDVRGTVQTIHGKTGPNVLAYDVWGSVYTLDRRREVAGVGTDLIQVSDIDRVRAVTGHQSDQRQSEGPPQMPIIASAGDEIDPLKLLETADFDAVKAYAEKSTSFARRRKAERLLAKTQSGEQLSREETAMLDAMAEEARREAAREAAKVDLSIVVFRCPSGHEALRMSADAVPKDPPMCAHPVNGAFRTCGLVMRAVVPPMAGPSGPPPGGKYKCDTCGRYGPLSDGCSAMIRTNKGTQKRRCPGQMKRPETIIF